jgi:hypothetical protein
MSILPAFKVILDNSLSDKECAAIEKKIKKIKGVISAAFNEASSPKQIWVTYGYTLHGSNASVTDKVRKIPGVTDIKPLL